MPDRPASGCQAAARVALKGVDIARQPVVVDWQRIVVDEGDDIAGSCGNTEIARQRKVRRGAIDNLDAAAVFVEQGGCAIGRGAIDNNNFEGWSLQAR